MKSSGFKKMLKTILVIACFMTWAGMAHAVLVAGDSSERAFTSTLVSSSASDEIENSQNPEEISRPKNRGTITIRIKPRSRIKVAEVSPKPDRLSQSSSEHPHAVKPKASEFLEKPKSGIKEGTVRITGTVRVKNTRYSN